MKMKIVIYAALIAFGCTVISPGKSYNKENSTKLSLLLLQFLDREIGEINKLALVDLMDPERKMYLADEIDDKIKTIGIYKFGILASHPTPYICFISAENVQIIEEYSTQNLLEKLSFFFKKHSKIFSENQKLIASKNVFDLLETRNSDEF